jgi:MFS family permease
LASPLSISTSSLKWTADQRNALAAVLGLLYIALITTLLYLWLEGWGYDDPYITYRYAENLARGSGLVYNLGERVQSTTTPLFALLLAALAFLPVPMPALANLIGVLSIALGAYILYQLAQTWRTPLAGWGALLFYPFFPLLLTTIGSETPLYLALCSASFLFYGRRSYTLTAVSAALATLARPDGILVPALIGLHFLFTILRESLPAHPPLWRRIPWRAVLVFTVLLGVWFLFAWAYFGSPLPVTLAAKQSQGTMAVSQRFAAGFVSVVRDHAGQFKYQALGALAALGLLFTAWRAPRWVLYLAWTAAYFAAYTVLGVSRYYWYYAPLVPGFIVLAGLGLQSVGAGLAFLANNVHPCGPKTDRIRQGLLAAVMLLSLGLAALLASSATRLGQHTDPRLVTYRLAGQWLEANTPPQAQIGALEIGILGYYADRTLIDFAGLLQPETANQLRHATSYDEAARWAVERYQPQYTAVQNGSLPGLEQDLHAMGCFVEALFPASGFGTRQPFSIYACPTNR